MVALLRGGKNLAPVCKVLTGTRTYFVSPAVSDNRSVEVGSSFSHHLFLTPSLLLPIFSIQ
jgi:hypothetical protein